MTSQQEKAVELALRKEFGLLPKQVLVSVPLEVLVRITYVSGQAVGKLEAGCQSDASRAEVDRLKRELACLWSDLFRLD